MTNSERISIQILSKIGLFKGLSTPELKSVTAGARVQRLAKDLRVFAQGDEGVRAHAVIEGGVRIAQSGSDGAQVVVRFIGPGEMFGAVALFTDGRYPADAITIADTLEASWSEAELIALIRRFPQIGVNAVRIVGRRLQEAQNRVRELSTQRAERRVAHAVLRLAGQASHNTADGMVIAFPLRRKDVADISGTTLHTASRILTAWEKSGFLISHKQHLTICQPERIRQIAEDGPG